MRKYQQGESKNIPPSKNYPLSLIIPFPSSTALPRSYLISFSKMPLPFHSVSSSSYFENGRNGPLDLAAQYLMMEACLPFFSTGTPAHTGKLLFSCSAHRTQEGEVCLALFDRAITESSQRGRLYVHLDFDIKFSFTLSPPSLSFQKGEQKFTYQLRSESDLTHCREVLKARLNQRGFHEQFKPKKKIGKGNFASVYLADKAEDGRSYAVKAFSKEAAYSEDNGKECLIKEIDVMRSLNHPNCMKLFEVFQSENSLYIVVQLLQGGLLYDKVKSKYKFKPQEARTIIASILEGLGEMHARKIMHRDLKPQNLIFREEGNWDCVIADFGLAEFSNQSEYLFVRCGTPGYVAPEVINIKDMSTKYDPICDIFSLGLIFHILLLGNSAFPGKTYNEVLAQNRASNITFQGEGYKTLDHQTLDLLKKMLKKNPQERISAADALKHPYLQCKQGQTEGEGPDVVLDLSKRGGYESPMMTSATPLRRMDKTVKKDSCVEFKMGKENVFTGKVETVTETGSTANSVGKRFESVLSPKASKFARK